MTTALFSHALRHGFWFCEHCDRVMPENAVSEMARDVFNDHYAGCPHCHKRAAVWHPAVLHETFATATATA